MTTTLERGSSTLERTAADKMVVIVFDNEKQAYEGTKALKDLHAEGSITLHASAVIAKDAGGNVSMKQAVDRGPTGTGVGLATGGLVGLLGGPVGLAVGAAAGMAVGATYDLAQVGVGDDYLADVSRSVSPGKTAVVAEIHEGWITPLDTRMEGLGGKVFRRDRGDFVDDEIQHEIEADKAEFRRLKAEHDNTVGQAKARLEAKVDAAKKKLKARTGAFREKIATIKHEDEAKIASLQDQAAKLKGETKAKLEKQLAEARARQKARDEKLSEALHLVKEAAEI